MAYTGRFGQIPEQSSPAPAPLACYQRDARTRSLSDDFRREELIRKIEHSVENLTLQVIGLPLRSSKNSKLYIMT